MKPYDNEEEKLHSQNIQEGYISLEQFGKVFHQKLDDYYGIAKSVY